MKKLELCGEIILIKTPVWLIRNKREDEKLLTCKASWENYSEDLITFFSMYSNEISLSYVNLYEVSYCKNNFEYVVNENGLEMKWKVKEVSDIEYLLKNYVNPPKKFG